MKLHIEDIRFHITDSCEPFYAVTFTDVTGQRMLAVAFGEERNMAVLDAGKVAAGAIQFCTDAGKAAEYASFIRGAIDLVEEMEAFPEVRP